MEELTEVITAAEFHPRECNLFVYSSSKGILRLCDMRQSALCDQHAKSNVTLEHCMHNSTHLFIFLFRQFSRSRKIRRVEVFSQKSFQVLAAYVSRQAGVTSWRATTCRSKFGTSTWNTGPSSRTTYTITFAPSCAHCTKTISYSTNLSVVSTAMISTCFFSLHFRCYWLWR